MARIALTMRYGRKMLVLPIEIHVMKPEFISTEQKISRDGKINFGKLKKYKAIWDTGATDTSINENVVQGLGLQQTGSKDVNTGNGLASQRPKYIVDLMLLVNGTPHIRIPTLEVVGLKLGEHIDALIGMDIIGRGDFAVTNDISGNSVISFALPGCKKEIDFVPEAEAENISGMNRKERRARGIK